MILLKVVLFMLFISLHHCRYPDKVYCVNKECSEPISKAKTLLPYQTADEDLISFTANSEAVIYMKSAGTYPELWYAEINGKLGFINSKFVREYKIIASGPQEIVPMQRKADVQPDKVQQAHEVFEGTTIYTTESTASTLQHDVTTESPAANPQPDSTPVLNTNKNVPEPNKIKIEGTPNQINDDKLSNQNMKADSQENAPDIELPSSVPVQVNAENEFSDNIEQNLNQPLTGNNVQQSENNFQQSVDNVNPSINPELPVAKEILPQPQQLVSSATGNTVNSDPIVDMPEKVDYLQQSLSQPESIENIEPNVSTSANANVENTTPQAYETTTQTTTEQSASTASVAINTDSTTQQPPQPSTDSYSSPDYNLNNQYAQYPQSPQVPVSSEFNNGAYNQNYDYNANQQYYQANLGQQQYASSTSHPEASTEAVNNAEVQYNTGSSATQEASTVTPEYQAASTGYAYSYSSPDPTTQPSQTLGSDPTASSIGYQSSPEQAYQPQIQDNTGSAYSYPPAENAYASPNPESTTQYYNYGSSETNTQQQQEFTTESYTSSEITSTPDNQMTTESIQSSSETTTTSPETTTEYYNYASSETSQESTGPTTQADSQTTTEMPVMMDLDDYLKSTQPPVDSNTVSVPEAETSASFFSTLYTSISDLWSSKPEAPASESTYNSDSGKDAEETFSYFNYFLSTYNSVMGTKSESNALFATSGNTCFTDEYCDGTSKDPNNRLLTFLVTTASSVLLFILGYYYIDGRRRDGKLIGTINTLQRDLLFSTKECEILKEELTSTKTKLTGIEDNSFGMDDMVQSLKEEIEELKAQNERLRKSLDDNEKLLRVSENTAHELQNTLSDVENTLSELLGERAHSEEHIADLNSKIQSFEEELMSLSRERDNFQLKFVSAEAALDETRKQKKQLEDVSTLLAEANNTTQLQNHEITALKDVIKELKGGSKSNVDVTSLIDHTEIKAKLAKALDEKHTFESKYEVERKERSRLSEELQSTQESLTTTNQQATEALTRLEVLGKYFQEREGELMKELSAKESLYLSKQGESVSTVEKIELMQQEVQRYKEKCDALTLELAEQESTRRAAVGALEAKAHGAWLEARAARRDADAARDDAQALRRKMASLTRAEGAVSPHAQMSSPLDGMPESGVVPPLPPLAFLPPPLLPPLPRPPPLGRLPSPHQPRYDRRYSPESRYSPASRYSPERMRASDRNYSPNDRRKVYSPRSRRRSRERYEASRGPRARNGPGDTETEYNSDSPGQERARRRRYSHSGPSSGSGCSSESDK